MRQVVQLASILACAMSKRGGKHAGAGRPPVRGETKEQRGVALTPRCWAFVALLALQLECSENETIERIIRAHPLFVPEPAD